MKDKLSKTSVALLLLLHMQWLSLSAARAMTIVLPDAKQALQESEERAFMTQLLEQEDYKQLEQFLLTKLKREPDNIFLRYRYICNLRNLHLYREAEKQLEQQIEQFEKKQLRYSAFYFLLFESYFTSGKVEKAKQLASKMIRIFAHRKDLLSQLQRCVRPFRDQLLNESIQKSLQKLNVPDTKALKTLYEIKSKPTKVTPPGQGLEILAETYTLPRFRFRATRETAEANSGVARYLFGAPDYSSVTIVNDESKNYYRFTIAAMLKEHSNAEKPEFYYRDVKKVGTQKLFGVHCDVYRCDYIDESLYDLICLAPSLDLSKNICSSVAETCMMPPLQCMPLCMQVPNFAGKRFKLLVFSLKSCKVKDEQLKLPKNYHRVKSLSELILAESGDLSDSDVDDRLESTKSLKTRQNTK